jgi:hypothetical protein
MSYLKEKLIKGYKGKFVIQHHWASHEHFDLRIEFPVTSLKEDLSSYKEKRDKKSGEPLKTYTDKTGFVLRSWAIPKHEIPTNKPLLAKETENHDISYGNFSGVIPEGNYGAGIVKTFDKGTFELVDVNYDKKYVFKFSGKKLNGLYALIKTKGKNFLWIKIKNTEKYKSSMNIIETILKEARIEIIKSNQNSPLKERRDYGVDGRDFVEQNALELKEKGIDLPKELKNRLKKHKSKIEQNMKKNVIAATAEEILNSITDNKEWNGPSGKCWCEALHKYISPQKDKCEACKFCPECESLFATDDRTYRYLHMHDDYKSFGASSKRK